MERCDTALDIISDEADTSDWECNSWWELRINEVRARSCCALRLYDKVNHLIDILT